MTAPGRDVSTRLLLVLALLSATAPIGTDLYLPSFPEVKESFHTSGTSVQLTLSGFLLGLGLGQIVWGPVADRFGRRGPLLIGTAVSAIASLMCVLAPSIEVLIAARFIQALAGAAALVLARAVIADLAHGFAAARALSVMMSVSAIAPVAAPVVGGALAGIVSWRWLLGVVFLLCLLQLLGVATTVPESLPTERRTERVQLGNLGRVLERPAFVGYAGAQMFGFGAMMSYISSSSFLYQEVIGTNQLGYGLFFGLNAAGMIVMGIWSASRARRRIHPALTAWMGLPVLLVSSFAVLVVAVFDLNPWLFTVPLFTTVASIGLTAGNYTALAIEQSRPFTGAGSSVLGGAMFLLGGAVAPLGGFVDDGNVVPLGIAMASSALLALASFTFARRYVAAHPEADGHFAAAGAEAQPA